MPRGVCWDGRVPGGTRSRCRSSAPGNVSSLWHRQLNGFARRASRTLPQGRPRIYIRRSRIHNPFRGWRPVRCHRGRRSKAIHVWKHSPSFSGVLGLAGRDRNRDYRWRDVPVVSRVWAGHPGWLSVCQQRRHYGPCVWRHRLCCRGPVRSFTNRRLGEPRSWLHVAQVSRSPLGARSNKLRILVAREPRQNPRLN